MILFVVALVAAVLAGVDLFRSHGQSLTAWGLLILSLGIAYLNLP